MMVAPHHNRTFSAHEAPKKNLNMAFNVWEVVLVFFTQEYRLQISIGIHVGLKIK